MPNSRPRIHDSCMEANRRLHTRKRRTTYKPKHARNPKTNRRAPTYFHLEAKRPRTCGRLLQKVRIPESILAPASQREIHPSYTYSKSSKAEPPISQKIPSNCPKTAPTGLDWSAMSPNPHDTTVNFSTTVFVFVVQNFSTHSQKNCANSLVNPYQRTLSSII